MEQFFRAADFFMIRCAHLPIETVQQVTNPRKASEFYRSSIFFQEALALASPTLHHAIKTSSPHAPKIAKALYKYLLRMSYRTTPFGLFASVGWGHFAEHTDSSYLRKSIEKKATLSLDFLQENERDTSYVMFDPEHTVRNNRVYIDTIAKDSVAQKTQSVRLSEPMIILMSLAKRPILFAKLKKAISKKFSDYPSQAIDDFFDQLFRQNFLQWVGPQKPPQTLKALLVDYEKSTGLRAMNLLEKICGQKNTTLRVDSFRKGSFSLHKNIKHSIEEAAQAYWQLSVFNQNHHRFLLHDFLEEFGTDRLVSLDEFVRKKDVFSLLQPTPSSDELSSKIFSQMNDRAIDLEEVVNTLERSYPKSGENAPLSFELYCKILSQSTSALDRGEYQLFITGGSQQAGATFGRFFHLWTQKEKQSMATLLEQEEWLLDAVVFAELDYISENKTLRDLRARTLFRKFSLSNKYIDIEWSDLYIGATRQFLYIYSKKLRKVVHFVTNNALNTKLLPCKIQLLVKICQSRFEHFTSPFVEEFSQHNYVPRFTYKNCIFSPARWKVSLKDLSTGEKLSKNQIETRLRTYFTSQNLPKHLLLSQFDRELPVDWTKDVDLQILRAELIKSDTLVFTEHILSPKNQCMKDQDHSYVVEIVVPLIKKAQFAIKKPLSIPNIVSTAFSERVILPGKKWFTMHLYMPLDCMDDFICDLFSPIAKNYCEKWFYIRYKDAKAHLRIRLKGCKNSEELTNLLFYWLEKGTIDNLGFFPYKREIERYGGENLMHHAEDCFCADTKCVSFLLKDHYTAFPKHFLAAIGSIYYALAFLPPEKVLEFFAPQKALKIHLQGARSFMKEGTIMIQKLFFASSPNDVKKIYGLLPLAPYVQAIKKTKQDPLIPRILDSLIHMHCNRLLGLERALEIKSRVWAYALFANYRNNPTNPSFLQ